MALFRRQRSQAQTLAATRIPARAAAVEAGLDALLGEVGIPFQR